MNSPDKYLRLGVDGPEELQNGFPTTREELFAYRGDHPRQRRGERVHARAAAHARGLRRRARRRPARARRRRVVRRRRLGRHAARRGAAGRDRAAPRGNDAAPVLRRSSSCGRRAPERTTRRRRSPTRKRTRRRSGATCRRSRRSTPSATSKPGATVLLTGIDERNREQVVLAYQRYGRGKALALPVQDTWLWRMHAKMAVKDHDAPHLLAAARALAGRRRARSRDGHGRARPRAEGRAGHAHREVVDPEYKGINDGRITAHVTSPSGKVEDVPMEWTVKREGEYTARFTPAEDGIVQGRRRRHGPRRQGRRRAATTTPRGAERRRVLRRRHARAAAQAHRRGDRRPVLHGRRHRRRSSTRSPTAARASRSSKTKSSGTCRSSCSCCWR